MSNMRKLLTAIVVVASSISLIHCASGGSGGAAPKHEEEAGPSDDNTVTEKRDASKPPPPPTDAAPPPRDAGVPVADARVDAAKPPPPPKPSATCQALATCCGALTSSAEAAACFLAIDYTAGHSLVNTLECAGTYALLGCSGVIATKNLGPSCSALAACCNSQAYGPYLENDTACTDHWRSGSESLCDADLDYYYNDDYGDCL
jgi:hypothetical protein